MFVEDSSERTPGRVTAKPTAVLDIPTPDLHTSGDHAGWHTSIAIGIDGLGLASYHDVTNQALETVHLGVGVP